MDVLVNAGVGMSGLAPIGLDWHQMAPRQNEQKTDLKNLFFVPFRFGVNLAQLKLKSGTLPI